MSGVRFAARLPGLASGLALATGPVGWAGFQRSGVIDGDRFRVRERYLPLMLSYLHFELLHMVRTRPLVSVAVGRDRYSVGYSPPGREADPLL